LSSAEEYIEKKLAERRTSGACRTLKPENSLIDFCSNDYLGFARSVILKGKIENEVNSHPAALNGATGPKT